jgi:hypothetical protein
MHVDGVGKMPGGIGVGVAGVDDDTWLGLQEIGKFDGSNQNVSHGSLSVEVGGLRVDS